MKKAELLVVAFVLMFFLASVCMISVAAQAAAQPGWEADWEKTLEAAKKEGKTNIYGVVSNSVRTNLSKSFTQKYGIELEFVTGRGSELVEKLTSERRAGIFLADVYLGGATTPVTTFKPKGFLDPLKPLLILPEVTDAKAWYGGGLYFSDAERQYVACPILTASNNYLSVNTDLVKPGEINSYKDLLNPKWKGKIIINDPTIAGAGSRWFSVVADRFMGLDDDLLSVHITDIIPSASAAGVGLVTT